MEKRCPWTSDNPQMIAYHATEWGVPVHNDRRLFGKLVLDGLEENETFMIRVPRS